MSFRFVDLIRYVYSKLLQSVYADANNYLHPTPLPMLPSLVESSSSVLTLSESIYHVIFSLDEISEPGLTLFTVALSRPPSDSEILLEAVLSGENSGLFSIDAVTTGTWNVYAEADLSSGRYEFDINIGYVNPLHGPQTLLGSAVVDIPSQGELDGQLDLPWAKAGV